MIGTIGTAVRATIVRRVFQWSPGRTSSQKIGMRYEKSKVVFRLFGIANPERGISALGIIAKSCCETLRCFMSLTCIFSLPM